MSRLGGSLFKVIWAQQHLDQLGMEVRRYVQSHPYYFPIDEEGDEVVIYPAELMDSPEFSIAGLIGDCMNNCMAALDYIVWELAGQYAGRPLVPPPAPKGDKPSFPLYLKPEGAENWATNYGRLYKVPTPALDEIKRVQPHNAGYEPLAQLYVLVNQDKHRLPLLLKGQLKTGDIRLTYRNAEFRADSSASNVAFKTTDPRLAPYNASDMKVDGQVTPFIAFADPGMPREPVEVTVERITACVRDVVNGFIDKKLI